MKKIKSQCQWSAIQGRAMGTYKESQFDKRKRFDSLKIHNVEQIQLKGMIHIYLEMSPSQFPVVSLFVKHICWDYLN